MRLNHLVAFASVALANSTIRVGGHHPIATTTVTETITTTVSAEISFTMVIEKPDATTMITLGGPSINVIVPEKGEIIFGTENLESMMEAMASKDFDRNEDGGESEDRGRGESQEEDQKVMNEKVKDEKVIEEKIMDEMSKQTQSER
ncbi:hypothetical protein QBC40DRAFT_257616 [Triangularia verruculosa]|uniref:Uncharacterized protein n=1 Tax=Triangularia verruculosa TaxID=2587418 RepID=A0AAN6XA90_9PEZI|nr:hypothetical protein QBC40DRAFT_257616 [Triangularia verruculosa]